MALVSLSARLLSNSPFAFTGASTERVDFSFKAYEMSISSLNQKNCLKPSIAPFNSFTKRPFIGKTDDIPGPGTYNNESTINNPKLMYLDEPYSLNKQPRFKACNSNRISPGPGSYFDLSQARLKQSNTNTSGLLINFHSNYNTLLNKRIRSIPSKDSQYGYYISDKGEVSLMEDPYKQYKFEGSKTNSVGPDQYEPFVKKANNAIKWNRKSNRIKYKIRFPNKVKEDNSQISSNSAVMNSYLKDITISNDSSNTNKIKQKQFIDEMMLKHQEEILDSSNTRNKSVLTTRNIIEPSVLIRNKLIKNTNNTINKDSSIMINNISQTKPERYQCFGSSSTRCLLTKDSNAIKTPGPGAYFHLMNKSINKFNPQNRSNSHQRNMSDIPHIDNGLGPGSYDIPSSINESIEYNKKHFGSSQKRFPEENVLEVGPGSYNISSLLNNRIKEYKQTPILAYHRNYRKLNASISSELLRIQPNKEDNNSNNNQLCFNGIVKKTVAPFSCRTKRFESSKDKSNRDLGPTSYSKDNLNVAYITKVNLIPFMSSRRREGILDNCNNGSNCGPGEYLHDSYFDKVKKSYNLRYV